MLPQCLSIPDAGKALGVSRSQIYRLLADQRLRSMKVGRRHVIPVVSLEAFIADGMRSTEDVSPTALPS